MDVRQCWLDSRWIRLVRSDLRCMAAGCSLDFDWVIISLGFLGFSLEVRKIYSGLTPYLLDVRRNCP